MREGSAVGAGEGVGARHNRGSSSEPHIHPQNTDAFNGGDGLPAPFCDCVADGVPVARGEPVRGQRVRPR